MSVWKRTTPCRMALTAFPEYDEQSVLTGRNLLDVIRQTNYYLNADPIEQLLIELDYMND